MSKFNTDVIYKVGQEAKPGKLEMGFLYFLRVPVVYAKVHDPVKKYNSEELAWSLDLFYTAETQLKIEDIGVNKEPAQVGVTKLKKGPNRGKIKYSVENEHFAPYEGMYALKVERDVLDKKGNPRPPLRVVDSQGEPFTKDVGNGSVCNIKLFTYRNEEGQLVIMLDTIVVIDHVPYERSEGYHDDILGVTLKSTAPKVAQKQEAPVANAEAEDQPEVSHKTKKSEPPTPADPAFDDDIPF